MEASVPGEAAAEREPPLALERVDLPGVDGLTEQQAAERMAAGQCNDVSRAPTRTVQEIVRANVFTRFNAILGSLLLVILTIGPFQDALFGIVLVSNTLIGIFQELRAKRALDRLALLNAPQATVVRDGVARPVAVNELVLDDVIQVGPGKQIPVDAVVLSGDLEVDESLLTGESEPVTKDPGSDLLSGSFVVAGDGRIRATRVGRAAYAMALAQEAKRFTLVRSELSAGIDRILRLVTYAIVPTAALLITSQLQSTGLIDAIRGSVAGVGAMIPEGLVLLTSVAFAVAVVRLGGRNVLVQELPSVEGLARVDVVCVDKTGTITRGTIRVDRVEPLADGTAPEFALGALAACDPYPNASLQAVGAAYPAPGWDATARVPFSSARKWAAATFTDHGTWVLGAPEVMLDGRQPAVTARAAALSGDGRRVMLVARAEEPLNGDELPEPLEPAALVVLEEEVRPEAGQIIRYFGEQGVAVKVISGDHPGTVGAIARRVGVPGAEDPVDGRTLPNDPDELAEVMEHRSVFGRVTPQQKRAMVGALQRRRHVVAMTGDGVNDVLALKDADIGVAMGTGSDAARSVAQIVLLDSNFGALPGVVAEGRRVIANIELVANLFLTKTVYAMFLALAVGVAGFAFPFLPRHLTIISSLTIGIPAFFLALAPNAARARGGFVGRVLRFAVPAGLVAAAATFVAYAVARVQPDVDLIQARTTATLVLFSVGTWVLTILARPLTGPRRGLTIAVTAAFVVALIIPGFRRVFALSLPPFIVLVAAIIVAAIACAALELGWRVAARVQRRSAARRKPSEAG